MSSRKNTYGDYGWQMPADTSRADSGSSRGGAAAASSAPRKLIPLIALIVSGIFVAVLMVAGAPEGQESGTGSGTTGTNGTPSVVNVEKLVKNKEKLSEYSTSSQSGDSNRAANIALAAEALNGTTLKSGEKLSFNETVGNTSQDERYFRANAIDGENVVTARGGGICQVSSALYVAALEAGLGIVERHPHTIAQDYVPLGLDATVSYGTLDLIIENTSDDEVVIKAEATGETCTVSIYGTPNEDGYTYEVSAQMVESDSTEDGDTTQWTYKVNSYLLTYEQGYCVRRTLLSTDTYTGTTSKTLQLGDIAVDAVK